MAGGLMQLIAYGAQDVFLTGNPQITFFKIVYRRHTNFSMECIQQSLNGTFETNGTQTATIARNGDLVHKSYLHVTTNATPTHTNIYRDGHVYKLLKYIQVEIGGQLIDKHYGDWNAVWWELTTPESKRGVVREMLTENSGYSCNPDKGNGIYYPLNFWFCKNVGLSIPLIALQNHEVKVKISWGTLRNANSTAELWCDYIYLDTDERRRFAQVSHEYLIEQVQRQTTSGNTKSIELNFDHPVKEIIWVNTNETNGTGAQFVPLGNAGSDVDTCYTPDTSNMDDNLTLKLTLNGHDRFAYKDAKYFKTVQPYQHHTYTPKSTRRTSSTFLSKESSLGAAMAEGDEMGMIINYKTSRLISAYFQTDAKVAATTLKLVHGSVRAPHGSAAVTGLELTGAIELNSTGADVSSYGMTMFIRDDKPYKSIIRGSKLIDADPPSSALTMIGLTSADTSTETLQGTLFVEVDELPHLIAGEGYNVCNIYSYSFALKPEEHQPSGTCNFSRLDSAKIISDSTIGNTDDTYSNIIVYAINYNVLRIMSGMGGLAYSS
tara:strand:+ start:1218 stop:2861 length:1644 start_codon:yes stop_codon:yes gene_type:complete